VRLLTYLAAPSWNLRTPWSAWRKLQSPHVPYRRRLLCRPLPALASPTMKVVSTFHRPSAVGCSTKCKFPPDDREYLTVGKTNSLELYSLQPKGLHLESALDIWGHIVVIRPVQFTVGPFPPKRHVRPQPPSRLGLSGDETSPHRLPLSEAHCCRAHPPKMAYQHCERMIGRIHTKSAPNHPRN